MTKLLSEAAIWSFRSLLLIVYSQIIEASIKESRILNTYDNMPSNSAAEKTVVRKMAARFCHALRCGFLCEWLACGYRYKRGRVDKQAVIMDDGKL